ncbi:hypothetical protein [Marinomonas sp.]
MKQAALWILILFLTGCSTYQQDIEEGLTLAQEGDWHEAESQLEKALSSKQDQLLYYLEIGALAQNQGDYERSNTLLEEAEKLSDTFFQENYSNRAWALLTNPRQSDYRGTGLERVYISYLKSLNYIALAKQAKTSSQALVLQDAALVEVRRIELKLNEIKAQTPSYQDLDDADNQAFYLKALSWLGDFYKGGRNTDKYLYRDDAWARYMEGLQYELQAEYDDARISYQAAANLYEAGYAQQYSLADLTTERAWLDTIRMMQKTGWGSDEIQRLIDTKLSSSMQQKLNSYQADSAEIVVLEHQGFIEDKSEMTLLLSADPRSYSLVLQPLHGGNNIEQNDSFRWFTMAYADISPLNLIANYKTGGAWGSLSGLFTKRVILGSGIWRQLQDIHIESLLSQYPVRVTVPFYRRFQLDNHQPSLRLSGTLSNQEESNTSTIRMTSLSDIALQEQLAYAQRDIYEGLLRELIRSWLAYRLASSVQDSTASLLLSLAGQVAVFASSAADTRNWLTLPAQIRLTRVSVPAGDYNPEYSVNSKQFNLGELHLKANQIEVWNLRNPD